MALGAETLGAPLHKLHLRLHRSSQRVDLGIGAHGRTKRVAEGQRLGGGGSRGFCATVQEVLRHDCLVGVLQLTIQVVVRELEAAKGTAGGGQG